MNMTKKLLLTGICTAVILLLSHYAFAAEGDTINVRSVRMTPASVTLRLNQERTLHAEVYPGGADDRTLTWSSGDTSVVSVDGNGAITAIGYGTARVTAASHNGKTAVCVVTVPEGDVAIRRLEISMDTATVRVNQERLLYVNAFPDDADYNYIEWTSSNPEVAMVAGWGEEATVTGLSPGTANITATSNDGKTAVCAVTVPGTVLTGIGQDVRSKDIPGAETVTVGTISAATLRLDVENAVKDAGMSKQAVLTYTDKTRVSTAALRSAAFIAAYNSKEASLRFRTLDEDGKLQGQLTIDPRDAGPDDRDVRLEVYTSAVRTASARARAAERFGTPAAVVRLMQEGAFPMTVQVAARADLAGADTKAMRIYRYAGGTYTRYKSQEYRIDGNGYIHFAVSDGGTYIFVSNP